MNKLLRTWIIGSKRSLSQWKLLTSLVLGVILACTIISSSSTYLDALEEIALNLAIDNPTPQENDLILQARAGPVSENQHGLLNKTVYEALTPIIGDLEQNRFSAIKSSFGEPSSIRILFTLSPTKRPNFSFSLSATSSDFFFIV